jgi:hypothetical protein
MAPGFQNTLRLLLAIGLLLGGGIVHAEVSADFVEIGARARGMGSAFTAVAAGVDALGWNPAGLSQLTAPELKGDLRLSFGAGKVIHGIRDFNAGAAGIAPVENFTDTPGTNFSYSLIGGAAPVPIRQEWAKSSGIVGGFAYRRVIDQLFRQEQLIQFDPGGGFTIPFEHIDDSAGGPDAFTFSVAGKAHSRVALGVNFNFLTGFNNSLNQQNVSFSGQEFFVNETETRNTFGGHMLEFGTLIDVTSKISVGGMLRPSFDVDQQGGPGHLRIFAGEGGPVPAQDTLITFKSDDATIDFPTFYTIGARATPFPGLLVAADWRYEPWNDLRVVQHTSGGDVTLENSLYPAHSFHLGGEYVFRRTTDAQVPVRVGFHTAPTSQANVDSLSADVGAGGFRNFRGDRVEGTTWTGGVGLYFPTVQFDISLDRTSYDFSEFLFNEVPPPGQSLSVVEIEETLTNIYFSSTIKF